MQTDFELYLDELCSSVKFKRAHKSIREEIRSHLEDQYSHYIALGFSEESAIEKSIEDTGKAQYIGNELNRAYKAKLDLPTVICTLVLVAMGFMTFLALDGIFIQEHYNVKYITYIIAGIALIACFFFFDYLVLLKYPYLVYSIGICLFLIAVINPASPLVRLDFFALIITSIGFSGILGKLNPPKITASCILALLAVGISVFCSLYVISICMMVSFSILLSTKIKTSDIKKKISSIAGIAAACIALFISKLLLQFGEAPQIIISNINRAFIKDYISTLLSNCNLFGKSNGFDTYYLLPELKSDYVLPFIASRFGLFFGFVVIVLGALLTYRFIQISLNLRNSFGRNLSICLSCFICVELMFSIVNMSGILHIPCFGFPFVSVSGIGFLGNCLLVGLVLSMWRAKSLISIEVNGNSDKIEIIFDRATKAIKDMLEVVE